MTDNRMLQSILDRVSLVDSKVENGFKEVNNRMKKMEYNLTKRIDKIGLQVARLEDDSPTIGEFDNLEKRVEKLEHLGA